MLIEVLGPEAMLDELRLSFEDELQNAGYSAGLRLGSMETGTFHNFVKGANILSVQVTGESEAAILRIEAEQEIPEVYDLWDAALISYGTKVKNKLVDFAADKNKVKQGLK